MAKYTCPRCGEKDDPERELYNDGETLGEDEPIECSCGALLLVDVQVSITLTARVDEDAESEREERLAEVSDAL